MPIFIFYFICIFVTWFIKSELESNVKSLFHYYEEFEQVTDSKVETLLLKVFVVIDFSLYKRLALKYISD